MLKTKSLNNGIEGSKKGRNHSMEKLGHVTSSKAWVWNPKIFRVFGEDTGTEEG